MADRMNVTWRLTSKDKSSSGMLTSTPSATTPPAPAQQQRDLSVRVRGSKGNFPNRGGYASTGYPSSDIAPTAGYPKTKAPLPLPGGLETNVSRSPSFAVACGPDAEAEERLTVCPKSHQLDKFNTPNDGEYRCNECHISIQSGTELYGCRTCNYDVCSNCVVNWKASLNVMTLNFQYFSSYPKNENIGLERLSEVIGRRQDANYPDIICVQEGLQGREPLGQLGYQRLISSEETGDAQSVHEMVYGDKGTLSLIPEEDHKKLLTNELWISRAQCKWEVEARDVFKMNSPVNLKGTEGRCTGPLAIRTMVWAKLRPRGRETGPFVFVFNVHVTGGRFEDMYFVQDLAEERRKQLESVIKEFHRLRTSDRDLCILVGDFNATADYKIPGPMHGYFESAIAKAKGVIADADAKALDANQLVDRFRDYMTAPFQVLSEMQWKAAYSEDIGATSGFGHVIDHMLTNREIENISAERVIATNQKFKKEKDCEIVLTDHNAVKVRFEDVFAAASQQKLGETVVGPVSQETTRVQGPVSRPSGETTRVQVFSMTADDWLDATVVSFEKGPEGEDRCTVEYDLPGVGPSRKTLVYPCNSLRSMPRMSKRKHSHSERLSEQP
mmetsp:Transcript_22225/g.41381  ORF Transcript_22225/g.41381 Transcript_22225/m.41381 type:complete len:613 (+) Transcript_22225:55-1893(+)